MNVHFGRDLRRDIREPAGKEAQWERFASWRFGHFEIMEARPPAEKREQLARTRVCRLLPRFTPIHSAVASVR